MAEFLTYLTVITQDNEFSSSGQLTSNEEGVDSIALQGHFSAQIREELQTNDFISVTDDTDGATYVLPSRRVIEVKIEVEEKSDDSAFDEEP